MDLVSEKRGQRNPKNKIDTTDIEDHLKSYQNPSDIGHNRITLPPELTIKKIYQHYVVKTQVQGKTPCKEKFFYSVAKKKFDIKFLKMKKEIVKTEEVYSAPKGSSKVIVVGVETTDKPHYLYQSEEEGKMIHMDPYYQRII